MTVQMALDLGRSAMLLGFKLIGPVMIFSLIVGLAVAIFQAATSIQEMTLTFIPKIVVAALVVLLFMPWYVKIIVEYTQELFGIIQGF
ncbi:MAG: flagellar biosynthesis protein FliQ [Candidatus Marinimicrobia bacterium]|nr:flagellar biosynthesis protein FliQ [Candidatus Neomarinimicrobiota bacterium]